MPREQVIFCGPGHRSAETDAPLRLSLHGGDGNVTLEVDNINSRMLAAASPAFVDLVEIATYVYCADQAVTRGGDDVDSMGSAWRRRMRFRIPVRRPDLWSSSRMQSVLVSTLGFLSEDTYDFEFRRMEDPPPIQQYFVSPQPAAESSHIEEVALLSGGLDSLGGAIRETLTDGRRVALVTHQSTPKFSRRQQAIIEALSRRATHAPLFVPVAINKSKGLGKEYTQRSRSFLYVSLGATVASMLGLSRVRFYENGVVSLNLPPSPQIIGSKATRTTHPRVLDGFAKILSLVADRRFEVENPFQWKTKTEIVNDIVHADCATMIGLSTSCMHTWEMTNEHPHCGSCSQCIDRRFAVLAAGAGKHDPAKGYKVDLLTGARANDEPRTLLSAYVETARSITTMSAEEFLAQFAELFRALPFLGGTTDSAALRVFELHRRHALAVTDVVANAIRQHATAIFNRSLPASCLLRLACDAGAAAPEVGRRSLQEQTLPFSEPKNKFVKDGMAWTVSFNGCRPFILLPSRGAAYLQLLLRNPGKTETAARLASTVAAVPEEYFLGNAGDVSDSDALSAYEAHFEELQSDLAAARERQDQVGEERIRTEMLHLSERIKRDRDIRGRPRVAGDNLNRVRNSVSNAIRRTIKKVAKFSVELAEHLTAPRLQLGRRLCYEPPAGTEWTT